MYTEDFIANIHGVLYHETLPKGHKKIDVKVFEEKKKTRQTDRQNTTVATLEVKLDEENMRQGKELVQIILLRSASVQ